MKQETKRRIRFYKKTLPFAQQKVLSALTIVLIATITSVTVSFAWITISQSPTVSGVATTIASNGSLEIALAPDDGSEPNEYDIDESVGISHDIYTTNLYWGNLINISDSRYGIDDISLRPAQLNTDSLLNSPLYGAEYSSDGRITTLNSDYAYVKWNGYDFLTSKNYGVRAIATYIEEISDSTTATYNEKKNNVISAHNAVNQRYVEVRESFSSVAGLLQTYAQDKLDDKTDPGTNLGPKLKSMINIYKDLTESMELQKTAYVALADLQLYMDAQSSGETYTALTWDDLVADNSKYNADSTDKISSNGVSLTGLSQFIKDYNAAINDYNKLNEYYADYKNNGTAVYMDSGDSGYTLRNMLSRLVNYSTMYIWYNNTKYVIVNMSSDDGMALMNQTADVYTTDGILQRFELTAVDNDYRINGKASCNIKLNYYISFTVGGNAYTEASGDPEKGTGPKSCYYSLDYNTILNKKLTANDMIAEDTYGLAVDFWVRTNTEKTNLILEGALVTDTNGEILRYDGVNRIWGRTGSANLTTQSTTQGGGSCYIYYADTPEDQAKSLNLLESMKVAFIDSNGSLLATADMDTENYYAVNGRITVPLVLNAKTGTHYTYTDDSNNEIDATSVTTLYLDNSQRITALVYIDGVSVTNDKVLSANEIEGQLNIQFGSSEDLSTVGDVNLETAERVVSAQLSRVTMDYDDKTDDLTTDVTITIDGDQASTVTAFFQRAISSTQGQRQEQMTFTQQSDGSWLSTYTFEKPGDYYLRYVRLDGVDYALDEVQKVSISGFAISSITWGEADNSAVIYSSDNSYTEVISVEFSSNDVDNMPSKVSARFVRTDGNVVSSDLLFNSSKQKWEGTARFDYSGDYQLQFLIIDGQYSKLADSNIKDLSLNLGLYATVDNNGSTTNDIYDSDADPTVYSKNVRVQIRNNAGEYLTNLNDTVLKYSVGSSSNSIPAQLTWDENEEAYLGTLPITKPGRYNFSSIYVNGSSITKSSDCVTYVVVSPNPPVYDSSSKGHYNDEIQFAPFTNDAYIGPITINDSASVSISAVVHNSISDKDYSIFQSNDNSENGTIYYDGDYWYINLPIYTLDVDSNDEPLANATWTQEGVWTIKSISIWDCYSSSGDGSFIEESNPLMWVDAYDEDNPSATITSFNGLSTEVSCTFNLEMNYDQKDFGSLTTDFMTSYKASDTGMTLTIVDDSDRAIPQEKINNITLTLNYTDNTDSNTYGYQVSGYSRTFNVSLNNYNSNDDVWEISNDATFEYCGEYIVNNLTVTMANGEKLTYSPNTNGILNKITVTTEGPQAENLIVKKLSQTNTIFGKTNNNITGTFLGNYNPGISVELELMYKNENGEDKVAKYARVEDVSLNLEYIYNGNSSEYGGYTYEGTSQYETFETAMNNNVSGSYFYSSTSHIFLAGTYSINGTITIGDSSSSLGTIKDIGIYSMSPTVKITSTNPSPTTTFQMNASTLEDDTQYLWTNVELINVSNYFEDYKAKVYMKAEEDDDAETSTIKYTAPKINLSLANLGSNYSSALFTISSDSIATFSVGANNVEITVGNVTKQTHTDDGGCEGEDVSYNYYVKTEVGDVTINNLTVTDSANTTYTVNLSNSIEITENHEAPPSISFIAIDNSNYTTPSSVQSEDGDSFTYTLPSSIGTESKETQVAKSATGWGSPVSDTTVGKYTYCSNISSPTKNPVKSGCSTTTYYYCTFTYSLYERHQYVYEKQDGYDIYQSTYGLTGWQIGDKVYSPGDVITVDSTITATPIIGEISRVYLREETSTYVHTTQVDISKSTTTSTGNMTATTSQTDCASQKYMSLPSGYTWFNTTTYTDKGDLNTTEHQTVDDYKK